MLELELLIISLINHVEKVPNDLEILLRTAECFHSSEDKAKTEFYLLKCIERYCEENPAERTLNNENGMRVHHH